MPRLLTSGVQFFSGNAISSSYYFVSNSVGFSRNMLSTQHFNYPASYPAPMIPSNSHNQSFPANFNSVGQIFQSPPANFNSIAPSVRSFCTRPLYKYNLIY